MNTASKVSLHVLLWLGIHSPGSVAGTELAAGVVADALPGGLRINGVAVEVTRLAGPGVPAFIGDLQARWHVAGKERREGPWQLLSRQQASISEVLQWRTTATGTEAWWSRLDLSQPKQAAAALSVPLPGVCRIASQLELGERHSPVRHVTARCGVRADTLVARLHRAAVAAGWDSQLTTRSRTLQLQRGKTRIQLAAVDQADPGTLPSSVLVAIEDATGAGR